jgi:Leucine-rich repeat (LRR) protein
MDSESNVNETGKSQVNIRDSKSDNQYSKIFSNIIKQIIDYNNEKFLNGEMNIIEYIISKHASIDINQVKNLKELNLRVISDYGLLNMIGECLPNLYELNLNNSIIPSISDIGANFNNLKILNVNNCGISDLCGMYY